MAYDSFLSKLPNNKNQECMITFFHRNIDAGYSINKVTQTFVRNIPDKEEFYVPCRRASLVNVVKNIWFVFRHRNKKGINHITGDIHYCILGLIGCKTVLTIHDTVALHFASGSKFKKKLEEWLWFTLPLRMATKVVCISEETKRLVQPFTNRKDLIVIHNAVDPGIKTSLKDYDITPYNILHIGTKPNKNLERTVQALVGIPCRLTVVGNPSQRQLDLIKKSGIEYCVKSGLTDEEIIKEYEACDVVTFISLFEGFGMPIIEANKVGRPVITSTIPVVKEVAADSAVFVDPYDEGKIREGFLALFSDSKLRKVCVEKGLENVKRFEHESITENYLNLYRAL